MTRTEEDLKRELGNFAGVRGPKAIVPAWVTAVNDDGTIAVEFADKSTIPDVQLKSVVATGNEVLLIPKVGSMVHIGSIENSKDYVVVSVSEITEMRMTIDNVSYNVTADGFLLKKDNDTLLDALTLLIEAVQKIVVVQGQNPDYIKLQQSLNKVQNLFKNA
jgi:hypothetical protein